MQVKVCGMREPENIQTLIREVGPDLMGMIFYPKSSRYAGEKEGQEFSSFPVSKVGVFVNASLEEVLGTVNDYGLSFVQLHGDEDLKFVKKLHQQSAVKIIKVFRVEDQVNWKSLEPFEPYIEYFLFDTQTKMYGGSGRKFDWALLEQYPLKKQFLLSGGIDEDSASMIHALANKVPQLVGVDINSKFEESPGLKDIGKIRRFVEALREN
ncbi:phosphoribosylanthranilate isomerase [Echinicola jeungdonensis]|uniref:N-(5'-phosphoribosyl)anthranilate isomerase n=1 Tax=Echinicola jeungdonensis TaxID=709343 RepID=A0ABV5J8T0_9BACT|nr:phosphoribosylanthranilate isomerase [Echinicola jeungdonensis]MDN3670256.1 phosphoribosylanthranilate isomerase [Echinicola jeungdonensis]